MALPTTDPSVPFQVYLDSGTLAVSPKKWFYQEVWGWFDISACDAVVSSLLSGKIVFGWRKNKKQYTYTPFAYLGDATFGSEWFIVSVTNGVISIVGAHGGKSFACSAAEPEGYVSLEFEFSTVDHTLKINGSPLGVLYSEGSPNTPWGFDASALSFKYGENVKGWLAAPVIYDGSGTELVDYSTQQTGSTLVDAVDGNDGEYRYYSYDGTKFIGLYTQDDAYINGALRSAIPYSRTDRAYTPKESGPFNTPPAVITSSPTDAERAYLRYKSDDSPVIFNTTGTPNWNFDIADVERNPDCWYTTKPMTCFSVLSDMYAYAAHITLITPRHAIVAEHVRDDFDAGDAWQDKTFYFMDLAGNTQGVQLIDYELIEHPDKNESQQDMSVCLLDAEVTLDIDVAKFMTDAQYSAYDSINEVTCGPTKEGYFALERGSQLTSSGVDYDNWGTTAWEWSRFNNYGQSQIGSGYTGEQPFTRIGDSSSPVFALNGTSLFYLYSCFLSGESPHDKSGIDSGSVLVPVHPYTENTYKDLINTAITALDTRNSLSTGYSITEESTT